MEPARRSLTVAGRPVSVSARALDLLILLIEQRDRVLGKDELRANVWRGQLVDDNNLAVQMSALRRALGEANGGGGPIILTIPGQGYQFVAALDAEPPGPQPAALAEPPPPGGAPPPARPRRRRIAGLAALALLMLAGGLASRQLRAPAPPRLSIAVLPFRNLGRDPDQDYLADAISDDLTTDLSHIPGSTVIARASADTFRDRSATATAIGHALNVRYLLEGSLRAEATLLHVNAQLIEASTGAHLWARAFDVPRDQLGAARGAIVRTVASALDVTLTEVEASRSLHDRPHGGDAEDYFLRARSVLERDNSLASLTEAQALLERAVAHAPEFTDALALLGTVLVRKFKDFDDPDDDRDRVRAGQVIPRALALAPEQGAAITANGYLAWSRGACDQATASFQAALSLDPNDVLARNGLVVCARTLGRLDEMIADLQDLMRIDPASPANARRAHLIGAADVLVGKPHEAIGWLDRAGAGLSDDAGAAPELGWQEWRLIYRIAAAELDGDHAGAVARYAAYSRTHKRRTVWRLASYETRAFAQTSGHAAFLNALQAAGMPRFAAETEDDRVPPSAAAQSGSDFDPTPLSVPGAATITTAALHALLARDPGVLLLDLGHGGGAIPGSVLVWRLGDGDQPTLVRAAVAHVPATGGRPIVVIGDGPTGWISYNAALQLVALGFRSVLWYRGGEEAWAAAGLPSEDIRPH